MRLAELFLEAGLPPGIFNVVNGDKEAVDAILDNPEIGDYLKELLPGHGVSAMVKEQLMNFIWDMTSGALAGRVALHAATRGDAVAVVDETGRRTYREFARDAAAFANALAARGVTEP